MYFYYLHSGLPADYKVKKIRKCEENSFFILFSEGMTGESGGPGARHQPAPPSAEIFLVLSLVPALYNGSFYNALG